MWLAFPSIAGLGALSAGAGSALGRKAAKVKTTFWVAQGLT